jgi:hypothetical protein
MNFTEEYYKSNNYTDYLSKGERYNRTAEELFQNLVKFKIINHSTKILDFGCSVGFLIKGLEKVGCTNVYGYDISEWAIDIAKKSECKILDKPEGEYELGIFLDVLEHMDDQQIIQMFQNIKFSKILVRIPVSDQSNPHQFYLDISRKDPTHINCKTDEAWIQYLRNFGFKYHLRLNFNTIYDSKGCFCAIFFS